MIINTYLPFFFASTVISIMPGPTVLLVVHYALQYGKWSGRFTIPAVMLGDIIALTLSLTGTGTILKLFPESFTTLKIIGGLYLIILGILSILSKQTIETENQTLRKPPGRRIFTHIFFITAFNPKSIIFFIAFFLQFINPAVNTTNQLLIMGITFVVLGSTGALIYDLAAQKINILIKKTSTQKTIHLATGLLLCGLGIATIIS